MHHASLQTAMQKEDRCSISRCAFGKLSVRCNQTRVDREFYNKSYI